MTEGKAKTWWEKLLWPNGPRCPHCRSANVREVKSVRISHLCRDCPSQPTFTLRTGTIMQGSQLKYTHWKSFAELLVGADKMPTSVKLGQLLQIHQASAWYMIRRFREAQYIANLPNKEPCDLQYVVSVFSTPNVGFMPRRHQAELRDVALTTKRLEHQARRRLQG